MRKKSTKTKAAELAFKIQQSMKNDPDAPDVLGIAGSLLIMMAIGMDDLLNKKEKKAYLNHLIKQIKETL